MQGTGSILYALYYVEYLVEKIVCSSVCRLQPVVQNDFNAYQIALYGDEVFRIY